MNLSYQEKSIWGSMVATIIVFGWYFATTPVFRADGLTRSGRLGHMASAVVLLVIIQIVYQVVVALKWRAEKKDERDIQIEGRAFRNAYFLLTTGALAAMPAVVIVGEFHQPGQTQLISPYLAIDILLLFLVAAEIVKSATQLFYYRRGL